MKDILWLVIIASGSTSTGGAIARAFDPTTVPKTLVVAMFVICQLSCAVAMAMATFLEVYTTSAKSAAGTTRPVRRPAPGGFATTSHRHRHHHPNRASWPPFHPRTLA